ncbi:GxxExxY protein [Cnuella takakiae]|uniref:GxxExxY protein n=2 Tax=Cnuella takakiae TaxID=1302690 RepID=A0A1M5F3Q5_9BACT|nr:GxxExxY protein [Cnuella takakiae]
MPIYFSDQIVGRRRIDFFVAEAISIETKVHTDITNAGLAQAINNLETHRLEIGLLLNFGAPGLQVRRLYNNKLVPKTK